MRIKFENPKLMQSEKADQLRYSSSTLQRKRNVIIMLSPYRIQPNIANKLSKKVSIATLDNNLQRELDLKRPQMTPKRPQTKQLNIKLKSCGNIEINGNCLDEVLLKFNLRMELAMQIISNDQTVGSNTL